MKERYIGIGAPAAPISAPETAQAKSLSFSVGTPEHSAASSESRMARSPRPIQEVCTYLATDTAMTTSSAITTKSMRV